MKAVQYALGWLIVWIGGLIQLPMMIVQFVMECLCYLFLPIAISLFAFESTKGLAIRYVQQTLAILAWPIGFAVVDLVGYSLLTSGTSVVSAGALAAGLATGFTPAKLVIGGIVAVWLILGSLVTPIVMQMLFCSGTPMSSAVGQPSRSGLGFAGASRFLKTGGGGGGGDGAPAPSSSAASIRFRSFRVRLRVLRRVRHFPIRLRSDCSVFAFRRRFVAASEWFQWSDSKSARFVGRWAAWLTAFRPSRPRSLPTRVVRLLPRRFPTALSSLISPPFPVFPLPSTFIAPLTPNPSSCMNTLKRNSCPSFF